MDLRYRTVGMRCVAVMTVLANLLAIAGCVSEERPRPVYLSDDSRLVGGGLKIEWKAPVPGTVYLVEKHTGKLIQTFTLAAGETYDFSVQSVVEANELQDLLGINIDKAQFLLYFKPAGPEESVPQP